MSMLEKAERANADGRYFQWLGNLSPRARMRYEHALDRHDRKFHDFARALSVISDAAFLAARPMQELANLIKHTSDEIASVFGIGFENFVNKRK